MKLTEEQVELLTEMRDRGTPVRTLSRQMGKHEATVRYRLRKRREVVAADGRVGKPTALDGHEGAVEAVQRALGDGRLTGDGRPVSAREIYELLGRDHGYGGSYQSVVRHLRRRYGKPAVRAVRRVETAPGVQAQHDWFDIRVPLGGRRRKLKVLLGTLSHSRAKFCWPGEDEGLLSWQEGHLALFRRYGGVPLWVRIDNLSAAVARGAGPTAELTRGYRAFASACGFEVDACRPGRGSDKGKVERGVRAFREAMSGVFREGAGSLGELEERLAARGEELMARWICPATGEPVARALAEERRVLQPLPTMVELFDKVVSRKVRRDCLVSFEGRQYSVPFRWVGRSVEVRGTLREVVIRGGEAEIARHERGTRRRLLIEPSHYEGASTDRVLRPTPLGRRARRQLAARPGPEPASVATAPEQLRVGRSLEEYARLVEGAG